MGRQLIIFIILTSGFSCTNKNANDKAPQFSDTVRIENKKPPENIRFDFTATFMDSFKETIEIRATLFNDNADTVYFLSTTGDGPQYSLQYDTSKFELTPFGIGNANFVSKEKIKPKGQYYFKAHFRYKVTVTKIKLGFDFYKVDKSFNLEKFNLPGSGFFAAIHYRNNNEKSIVWANEREIE